MDNSSPLALMPKRDDYTDNPTPSDFSSSKTDSVSTDGMSYTFDISSEVRRVSNILRHERKIAEQKALVKAVIFSAATVLLGVGAGLALQWVIFAERPSSAEANCLHLGCQPK